MRPVSASASSRMLLAFLAAVSAALGLGSCAYLLADPYGETLQKAQGWANLRQEMHGQTGLDLQRLSGISAVGGYVFFQAEFSDASSQQFALNYGDLSLVPPSLFGRMSDMPGPFNACVDYNGHICLGRDAYDPGTFYHWATGLPGGPWLLDHDNSTGSYNYYFNTDTPNQLAVNGYAVFPQNPPYTTTGSWYWSLIGPAGENWTLARVLTLDDYRVCLLFYKGDGSAGAVRAGVFANMGAFLTLINSHPTSPPGYLLGTLDPTLAIGDPIKVVSFNGSFDSPSGLDAWITRDGIVAVTADSNGRFTFSRYPQGPGGEIDRFSMSSGYDSLFYFEPSGKYWYSYDPSAGRLFRLRTWWS
jgi:hypothetical protein